MPVSQKVWKRIAFLLLPLFFASSALCFGGQWRNPQEVIRDPWLARLQQGRKELTEQEKEDLKRYGYTGLELMTYVDANKEPEQDRESFFRTVHISAGGRITNRLSLIKRKLFRKSYRENLTYEGIKPGDVWAKRRGISLFPPQSRRLTWMAFMYLRSLKHRRLEEGMNWRPGSRKVVRYTVNPKENPWVGMEFTFDDVRWRKPWEEDHRILGEDRLEGKRCWVVESRYHLKPDYYLQKRVSWVGAENFLDLHEEQFNRMGKLFKVIDNLWVQIPPWNYWVRNERYYYNLATKNRSLIQRFGWIFDQGIDEALFNPMALHFNRIWREPKNLIPPISISQFSPPPGVRWEFWDQLRERPDVAK